MADFRNQLRNKLKSIKDEDRILTVKSEISEVSKEIGKLRREVSLCDEIDRRSKDIEAKLQIVKENTKSTRKEPTKDEQLRRRR